jgi:hypothetical protein
VVSRVSVMGAVAPLTVSVTGAIVVSTVLASALLDVSVSGAVVVLALALLTVSVSGAVVVSTGLVETRLSSPAGPTSDAAGAASVPADTVVAASFEPSAVGDVDLTVSEAAWLGATSAGGLVASAAAVSPIEGSGSEAELPEGWSAASAAGASGALGSGALGSDGAGSGAAGAGASGGGAAGSGAGAAGSGGGAGGGLSGVGAGGGSTDGVATSAVVVVAAVVVASTASWAVPVTGSGGVVVTPVAPCGPSPFPTGSLIPGSRLS